MTNNTNEGLRECPFDGHKPKRIKSSSGEGYFFVCSHCDSSPKGIHKTVASAKIAWNTRHTNEKAKGEIK